SNIDGVLAKLHDDEYLEALTERAYADIIGSERYTYQAFVQLVDEVLEKNWRALPREQLAWLPLPPCHALPMFRDAYRKNFEPNAFNRAWRKMPGFVRAVISRERVKRVWLAFPSPLRALCRPILQCIRSVMKPAH